MTDDTIRNHPAQPVPQSEHPVYCYGIYPVIDEGQIEYTDIVLVSTPELAEWTKDYLTTNYEHISDLNGFDSRRTIALEAKVKLSKQMVVDHIERMFGDETPTDDGN